MSSVLHRVVVAVVSAAVLAAPFATGAAIGAPACGAKRGYWTTVRAPRFAAGPQTVTAYGVSRYTPATIYLTNGTAIMRTIDGACSWKQVFELPATPSADSQATAASSQILSIEIPERLGSRVLVMVEERTIQGSSRPHVIRSDDSGDTWAESSTGLPPQGAPEALVTPLVDPSIAYIAIDVGGGSVDFVFGSADGGATWTLKSNPAGLRTSMGVSGMTVDPLSPMDLWAWGSGGLYHSGDGGGTFAAVPHFAGTPVSTAAVFHAGNAPAQLVAFKDGQTQASISANGGATWLDIAVPTGVSSVAFGDEAQDIYVTAGGRVHSFHALSFTWPDLQAPTPGLAGVTTDTVNGVYAHSARTLEVYNGPLEGPPPFDPDDAFDVPLVNPPASLNRKPPTLVPRTNKVVIDPGGTKTVRYKLDLPSRPLPLNVFFLLDTSDSMGATIGDLADSVADIINQLNTEKIELKVGIGAFRAYPDRLVPDPPCSDNPSGGRCEKNYVYQRVLDITSDLPLVEDVLEALESDAGGFYKSHLGALWHLATGAGADIYPPGPDAQDVPAGLQANFDENSLRVVLHATDEAFGDDIRRQTGPGDLGNPDPPEIPEFDEVATALNAKGIMQIGLSIGSAPRKDLERVAGDTGAVAPAEGVDCGKGYFIEPGDPLVCTVQRNNLDQSHNLVPAIVNTLEAVPDATDVTLEATGNDRIIQGVTPRIYRNVVEQVSADLPFEVTYHCPLQLAGKRFDVKLDASRDTGKVLGNASSTIVCRAEPKNPDPLLLLPAPFALLAPLPPPPPPPLNVTSASQAQSQAQAQGAAAFQEEKQPQVAVAAAYREAMQIENAYEYEMVAYSGRRKGISPYWTLGAGIAMSAMAYALMAINRQRSIRLAPQRQRSSRLRHPRKRR